MDRRIGMYNWAKYGKPKNLVVAEQGGVINSDGMLINHPIKKMPVGNFMLAPSYVTDEVFRKKGFRAFTH